jgi:hypothetical protein
VASDEGPGGGPRRGTVTFVVSTHSEVFSVVNEYEVKKSFV